jgi:hypothetical protein
VQPSRRSGGGGGGGGGGLNTAALSGSAKGAGHEGVGGGVPLPQSVPLGSLPAASIAALEEEAAVLLQQERTKDEESARYGAARTLSYHHNNAQPAFASFCALRFGLCLASPV